MWKDVVATAAENGQRWHHACGTECRGHRMNQRPGHSLLKCLLGQMKALLAGARLHGSVINSPLVSKYCDQHVCLFVCLSI